MGSVLTQNAEWSGCRGGLPAKDDCQFSARCLPVFCKMLTAAFRCRPSGTVRLNCHSPRFNGLQWWVNSPLWPPLGWHYVKKKHLSFQGGSRSPTSAWMGLLTLSIQIQNSSILCCQRSGSWIDTFCSHFRTGKVWQTECRHCQRSLRGCSKGLWNGRGRQYW